MEIQMQKSTTILPAKQTPKVCLRLSVLDLMVRTNHISNLFFYRRPNNCCNFFDSDLVKEALSNVLVPFYPMAGRLGRDENGRMEIYCNGKGVLFVEAETSCVIDDLGDFSSSSQLLKLVPTVDPTEDASSFPLLLAQVTRFRCGGVCVGCSVYHTVADATSIFHFMMAWAETTRGIPISNPPTIDQKKFTLAGAGIPTSLKFHHIEYDPPPSMNSSTQVTESQSKNSEPLSATVLHLSVDQLNMLKAKSMEENHLPTVKFTQFEILVAHIWRCLCKARGLSGYQFTKLHMPVNGRSKLNPPLPFGYLGNVIFTAASIALSGNIQSESFNSTVERVHKALKRMDHEYLKSALNYLNQLPDATVLKRGAHTYKCPNLSVSNVFHMPVYDANFGWGRPVFVRPLPFSEGVVQIFPSPRDDGSLYLIINLETQHFQHFKKSFYEIFQQCQSARSKY